MPNRITKSKTPRINMACGKIYPHILFKFGEPYKLLINKGKGGGCENALLTGLAMYFNCAIDIMTMDQKRKYIDRIIEKSKGINCPGRMPGEDTCTSCIDAIAKLLEYYSEEDVSYEE